MSNESKDRVHPTDCFVVNDLLWHYNNFGTKQKIPFESYDPDEELRYVKKMRKALKRVLKYYGKEVE